jgi:dTDP-4-dehydrorhamnose reductase
MGQDPLKYFMRQNLFLSFMDTLLVTGASGFLGWNICLAARQQWNVVGLCHSSEIARGVTRVIGDSIDFAGMDRIFREIQPDAVIHAAALSDPNYCELHPSESLRVNVEASEHIAQLCSRNGARCAFISTDLVFDGEQPPYSEKSLVNPVGVYGRHKAEAEKRMSQAFAGLLVCRMPLMFGDAPPAAKSFIHPMIDSLMGGKDLALFVDEFRTPVAAADAARGILSLVGMVTGTVHLGGKVRISRYDFGRVLGECLGLSDPKIAAVFRKDLVMPAPRPADVSLDSSKAFSLGYDPDKPRVALMKCACVKNRGNQ